VRGLSVADGTLFYSDTPDGGTRIMRIPVDGGTPHFVVRTHAGATTFGLAANGGSVFYVDSYSLMRVDVQTKQIAELASNLFPIDIEVANPFLYAISCTTSDCTAGTAYRVPRAGGAIEALGSSGVARSKIDVIDDSLQWGSHVISLAGAPERDLLDSQDEFVVAATPQAFYFGERATGTIYRAAR
jgi:hypothetical protein